MSPGQLYACGWYGHGCSVQLWTGNDGKCPGCGRTGIPLKPRGWRSNGPPKKPRRDIRPPREDE